MVHNDPGEFLPAPLPARAAGVPAVRLCREPWWVPCRVPCRVPCWVPCRAGTLPASTPKHAAFPPVRQGRGGGCARHPPPGEPYMPPVPCSVLPGTAACRSLRTDAVAPAAGCVRVVPAGGCCFVGAFNLSGAGSTGRFPGSWKTDRLLILRV